MIYYFALHFVLLFNYKGLQFICKILYVSLFETHLPVEMWSHAEMVETSLYDDNMDIEEDNDSSFRLSYSVCEYYEPDQFSGHVGKQGDYTSYFHILTVVVYPATGNHSVIDFVACMGIILHLILLEIVRHIIVKEIHGYP